MVAVHPVVDLEMADHRLDRRATPERALDRVAQPALLAGHVHPEAPLRRGLVALVAGIGDHLLQLGPDRALDVGDHALQRMPVIRVARQRLHVRHELAALAAPKGRGDAYLDPELAALVRFALADALHLGSMQRVDLPAPLAPALVLDAPGQRQRQGEDLGEIKPVGDLAGDVAHQSSEHRADALQGPVRPLELPRVRVALVLDQPTRTYDRRRATPWCRASRTSRSRARCISLASVGNATA